MPVEPPASPWILPNPDSADEHGLVGVGADLNPGTILAAYRNGLFPMPVAEQLGWWSPDPRGVMPLDGMHVSRSLRRSSRRYSVTIDQDFPEVMAACADPSREGGWISPEIMTAYGELHRLGWAHSFETRNHQGELVGGVYGVSIGRLFAGESMFHRSTDASKVALLALVEHLGQAGGALLDVQWKTEHLATLGVIDMDRQEYVERCREATACAETDLFG